MSAGGTLAAMQATLKANKALLRRTRLFEKKDRYKGGSSIEKIDLPKATPAQLAAIRAKMEQRIAVAKRRKVLALGVSLIIAGFLTYLMIWLFSTRLPIL